MYQYSLYLFKPNFALHFYYKIDVLYQFLLEQANHHRYDLTKNQLNTVLEKIDTDEVMEHLQTQLNSANIDNINGKIEIRQGGENVTVEVNGHELDIYASSLFIADRLFFQYIKSFHPHIFVVNFDTNDCGWISPLAKRELYRI